MKHYLLLVLLVSATSLKAQFHFTPEFAPPGSTTDNTLTNLPLLPHHKKIEVFLMAKNPGRLITK